MLKSSRSRKPLATGRMRPIIVEHSLGGLLGLMLAKKYPQYPLHRD